jgi:hypothetical protein
MTGFEQFVSFCLQFVTDSYDFSTIKTRTERGWRIRRELYNSRPQKKNSKLVFPVDPIKPTGPHGSWLWKQFVPKDLQLEICRNMQIILSRTTMSKPEFDAYLKSIGEDIHFWNLFTDEIVCELLQLREEYANPEIQLEITLDRTLSFFMKHWKYETPNQVFLLFFQCLSSKCFYFNRKRIGKKWNQKNDGYMLQTLKRNEENLRIQSFFYRKLVDLIISIPSFLNLDTSWKQNQEIEALKSFILITRIFLYREIPDEIVSLPIQRQICETTSFLLYSCVKDPRFVKQLIRKFQLIHRSVRRFLIGRSHITLVLVFRLFRRDAINKLKRIPNSFVSKLMMTIGIFPEFVPSNHFTRRFLSLPMHDVPS